MFIVVRLAKNINLKNQIDTTPLVHTFLINKRQFTTRNSDNKTHYITL